MRRGKRWVVVLAVPVLLLATGLFLLEPAPPDAPGVPGALPAAPAPPARFTLLAGGDVMLARNVGRLMDELGVDYPLAELAPVLREADLAFVNLESPVATSGEKLPGKGIWFRARPEAAQALATAGVDVVSLANNHAMDYREPALLETVDLLREAGVRPVGAGRDLEEARRALLLEVAGYRVVFLAYTEMADLIFSRSYPRPIKAGPAEAGVNPLVAEAVLADVAAWRERADFIFVSLHWGVEYANRPTKKQQELARAIIDAGATAVLGHHPHVMQGVEIYRGRVIAYSLGNLVFDQYQRQQTQEGLLLKLTLGPGGLEEAEVWPVVLPRSRARVASGEDGARIVARARELSGLLGTRWAGGDLRLGWAAGAGEPVF